MGALGSLVAAIAAAVVAATATISAFIALRTNHAQHRATMTQIREARGRWLVDLFKTFISEPSFAKIRTEIYLGGKSDLAKALEHIKEAREQDSKQPGYLPTRKEAALLVDFDNYLDFLGLIERLIVNQELDEEDAYRIWSWYVLDGLELARVIEEVDHNFQWVMALRDRFNRLKVQHSMKRNAITDNRLP